MPRRRISVGQADLICRLLHGQERRAVIADAAGVSVRTVHRVRDSLGGMLRPADVEYDKRYLTIEDRREIARLHESQYGVREIARRLGRHPSTISRELRRNVHSRTGYYLPEHAHTLAWRNQRRPKPSKIAGNPRLAEEVQRRLDKRHSPEQIAGRLPVDFPDDTSMRISYESIYQSLYVYPRGELTRELKAELRSKRTRRHPRGSSRNKHDRISGIVSIHDRPEEVEGRLVPGHHEGDLIKGTLRSNSAVGTVVERQSGFVTLLHLPNGWASEQVVNALIEEMGQLPRWFAKTLTWDRGVEMAEHDRFTKTTKIKVYFADPHCPQQRPTNENTNGLLREYLPKGTDLSVHTRADLAHIAEALNTRPRKRLKYQTPAEVFAKLLEEDQTHGVATTS